MIIALVLFGASCFSAGLAMGFWADDHHRYPDDARVWRALTVLLTLLSWSWFGGMLWIYA